MTPVNTSEIVSVVALVISVLALIAAGASALFVRSQAKSAKGLLEHETEARFKIVIKSRFELEEGQYGEGGPTDAIWFLENNGKGLALSVSVTLEFDEDALRHGRFNFERIEGGSKVWMKPSQETLPDFSRMWIFQQERVQRATISWATPDGSRRSVAIPIGL